MTGSMPCAKAGERSVAERHPVLEARGGRVVNTAALDLLDLLAASRKRVERLLSQLDSEQRVRDDLMTEALAARHSVGAVADAAGLSKASTHARKPR